MQDSRAVLAGWCSRFGGELETVAGRLATATQPRSSPLGLSVVSYVEKGLWAGSLS
jgi:hypothetical protein